MRKYRVSAYLLLFVLLALLSSSIEPSSNRTSVEKYRFDLPIIPYNRTQDFRLRKGFKYVFELRVEPAVWDKSEMYKSVPIYLKLYDRCIQYGDQTVVPPIWRNGKTWFTYFPKHDCIHILEAGTLAPLGCLATLQVEQEDLRIGNGN